MSKPFVTYTREGVIALIGLNRPDKRNALSDPVESFFAAQGITPGQISILIAVSRNPGVRQGGLADALRIKWSNMAKIVSLLEGQGLIERQVPVSDRRAVDLHREGSHRRRRDGAATDRQ